MVIGPATLYRKCLQAVAFMKLAYTSLSTVHLLSGLSHEKSRTDFPTAAENFQGVPRIYNTPRGD